ncbi:MAG: HAD family hydrolase [Chloroflexota bacterium]
MNAKPHRDLVFLLDVDNTLLDNDKAKEDMAAKLLDILGKDGAERFWDLYEEVRKDLDVVSYPETLTRFAKSWKDKLVAERAADLINNWPYTSYVYSGTLPAIRHMENMGEVAILSDGDDDYQPRKIANAGLADAVGPDDLLIYTHKETCFPEVMQRMPGDHYVLVDDKERLLALAKEQLGSKLTTVWVRQGKYAHDPKQYRKPDPDITIETIGDICDLSKQDFLGLKRDA